jgi:hypothetical protein
MPDQRGTLEAVARHLALAVEPLRRAVADLGGFQAFLLRLGWEATTLPPAYRELAGIVDRAVAAAEALADDPGPEEALEVLAEIQRLHQALDALDETPGGIAPTDRTAFAAELADRVFELLLTDYLAAALPTTFQAGQVLGIIEVSFHEATATRPAFLRTRLHFDRIPPLLTDPGALPRVVYGWGTPEFRFDQLRDHVYDLLSAMGLAASIEQVPPDLAAGYQDAEPELVAKQIEKRVRLNLFDVEIAGGHAELGAALTELPAERAGGATLPPGVIVEPAVPPVGATELELDEQWTLGLRAGTDPAALFGVLIRPGSLTVRFPLAPETPPPPAGFGATLTWTAATSEDRDTRLLLLGRPGGGRLELAGAALGFRLDLVSGEPELTAEVALQGLVVVITAADLDGFLDQMLGGRGVTVPVPLGVTWSSRSGVSFTGAAGFELVLTPGLRIGPVAVDRLTIALRGGVIGGRPAVAALAGVGISGQLGPIGFTVEGLGLELDLLLAPGNSGPAGIDVGLRPPTGLGLALDAGPVQGGGFIGFDPATGRYAGALAVRLGEVAIRAVGLLDTRLPGGQRGFALLVMLSARFSPGIQLAFGITLTGVGGLIAVNRRVDVDALRERFANGTAGRILNPPDPTHDLGAQLSELSAVFPPAEGVAVVGPTLQLQWAKLVTLDVGIFLELPGPSKVVLLGTARAVITNPLAKGPLLQLRADFIGVIDLDHSTIAFDAVLIDSRLLETFAVTGGMSLRANLSDDDPFVLLSVGGFHPDFTPPKLALPPTLTRLAMTSGSPDDRLYLRFEGYFAITPNTMQFGASVEVAAKLGPLRVRGFIGFDALIAFEPFFFTISFEASLRVQFKGHTLAGVKVTGTLSGPGPVTFHGKACIELLFFDVCASATFTLGSDAPPAVTPVPSAFEMLATELRDPANLRAASDDPLVALRPPPRPAAGAPPVLPPTGVVWQQARAPLGLLLERFEGTPLRRPETITATSAHTSGEERDWFAPGSYAELTDADALDRRSFERLAAGVRLATGDDGMSNPLVHTITVEEIRLPQPRPRPPDRRPGVELPDWLLDAAHVREGRTGAHLPPPVVQVSEERWQVLSSDGRPLVATTGEAQAHQLARAASERAVAVPVGDVVELPNL